MATTPRKGTFSTQECDEILRKYGTMPTPRLAQNLRRNPSSVERRAQAIFKGPEVRGSWTDDETTKLTALLGTATVPQLSTILRRRRTDIHREINRLRYRTKSDESLTDAARIRFNAVYGSRTNEDLSTMFGVTQRAVDRMATQQCLQKDKAFLRTRGAPATKMPRWAQAEVDLLTKIYPGTSNHEIAQRLTRSTKSIVSKAHSLRLKKDPERLRQMGRENISKRYR